MNSNVTRDTNQQKAAGSELGVLVHQGHIRCQAAGCWWTTSFVGGREGVRGCAVIYQPWWVTKLPRKPPVLIGVAVNCCGMWVGEFSYEPQVFVFTSAPRRLTEGGGERSGAGGLNPRALECVCTKSRRSQPWTPKNIFKYNREAPWPSANPGCCAASSWSWALRWLLCVCA